MESDESRGDARAIYRRACETHLPSKPNPHLAWSAYEERLGRAPVIYDSMISICDQLATVRILIVIAGVIMAASRMTVCRRVGRAPVRDVLIQSNKIQNCHSGDCKKNFGNIFLSIMNTNAKVDTPYSLTLFLGAFFAFLRESYFPYLIFYLLSSAKRPFSLPNSLLKTSTVCDELAIDRVMHTAAVLLLINITDLCFVPFS